MKKIVCVLLIGLGIGGISSSAIAVGVAGGVSCKTWTDVRRNAPDSPVGARARGWLLGYISGLTAGNGVDFLSEQETSDMLFGYADTYCKNNPSKGLNDAGLRIGLELARSKGLLK